MKKRTSTSSEVITISRDAARVPSELAEQFASFARDVEETAAGLSGAGWAFISTKGGEFKYKQEPLDSPLRVAIVGVAHENTYYDKAFDPESTEPPKCTAIGRSQSTLAPPAEWPTKESESCKDCWANAWGSGRGRGKACANRVRLCVVPIYKGVDVAKVEGARLRVPPTSLPNFNKLVAEVKALNNGVANVFAHLVEVDLESDPKTMFKMTFKVVGTFPEAVIRMLHSRITEASGPLLQIFDPAASDDVEEARSKPKKQQRGRR